MNKAQMRCQRTVAGLREQLLRDHIQPIDWLQEA